MERKTVAIKIDYRSNHTPLLERKLRLLHSNVKWSLDRWSVIWKYATGSPAAALRSLLRSLETEYSWAIGRGRTVDTALSLLPRDWQFWTVATFAIIVMAIMQYNVPLWYGGSDHGDYYWYGRFLLGDVPAGYALPPNWRTPGM